MLLLAAIVVVAGRWESISPEVRFAGLVASLLGVYFAAETLRSRVRLTATALATLAAALTAPVGIAAAATLEQEWPVCVLAGGLAALLATELQSRRWQVTTLKAATAVAVGLATTGLAALVSVPVGLITAVAAAIFLAFGAAKRSIALASAVGCAPALLALADAGVGPGTLARIGATGPELIWAAPVSAVIAAGVIAVSAHRRSEVWLVALATLTLVSGLLVGAGSADLSTMIWWCLPGAVLLLIEAVSALGRNSIWSTAADRIQPVILGPVALLGAVTPIAVALTWIVADFGGTEAGRGWALPAAVTAAALWAATGRVHRTLADLPVFAPLFGAAASASLAAAMSVRPGEFGWFEIGTLAAIASLMAGLSVLRSARWAHGSALLFVTTGSLTCALLGLTATHASLAMITVAAVLSGIGFLRVGYNAVDTAALATMCVAVAVATGASAAVLSIALVLLSALGVLYGLGARREDIAGISACGFAASLVSLWWTSGANVAAVAAIAPYGADGGDLALLVATAVLIGVGAIVRGAQGVSSWLAYSPGLGMAAAWLLATQLDDASTWATLLALTIGVAATAVGGTRRLGAPLLIGTVMIVASVGISAGSRLAAAPTWLWIAAGGLGLLVLAAVVERSDRPLIVSGDSQRSVVQQFCDDFD